MSTGAALVTGAGSGIGAEVARALAGRGQSVALLDRSADGLARTATEIENAGGEAVCITVDVRHDEEVAAGVSRAVDAFGGLSTVVVCAGVETYGDVTTVALADWERTLQVNLNGVFLTARHTIPHLIKDGAGSFTAIASDAGVCGAQGYAAYVASKHAVVGLVKCLALDFGPSGVRSNVVCPSFVDTPMAERIFQESSDEEIEYYRSTIPLGRFARAAEVAAAVVHLSSAEASYVNGLVYRIDGGATAGYFKP